MSPGPPADFDFVFNFLWTDRSFCFRLQPSQFVNQLQSNSMHHSFSVDFYNPDSWNPTTFLFCETNQSLDICLFLSPDEEHVFRNKKTDAQIVSRKCSLWMSNTVFCTQSWQYCCSVI